MTIRTRLFALLLPLLVCSILLVSCILSYNWYKEIKETFETKLKSIVVNSAAILNASDGNREKIIIQEKTAPTKFLYHRLIELTEELDISTLFFLSPSSDHGPMKITPIEFEDKSFSPLFQTLLEKATANHLPYLHNDVVLLPYHFASSDWRFAYVPIFHKQNDLVGYIGAYLPSSRLQSKLQQVVFVVIFSSLFILFLTIATLVFLAKKIVRPVQKLNSSAMVIAAGKYGENISVKGPKEIVELSSTLNTMSHCLQENLNHLKENAIIRERMYGEQECAQLLQKHMFNKVLDECLSDALAFETVQISSSISRGLLLDIPPLQTSNQNIDLHFVEAREKGFLGMYELLTNYRSFKKNLKELDKNFPFLQLKLFPQEKYLYLINNQMPPPLLWRSKEHRFERCNNNQLFFLPGDYLFLFSRSLIELLGSIEATQEHLQKILKHFDEDGIETCRDMIHKELKFITDHKPAKEDIHLLTAQFLY